MAFHKFAISNLDNRVRRSEKLGLTTSDAFKQAAFSPLEISTWFSSLVMASLGFMDSLGG
jgi:hypothetical protein